MRLRYMPTSFSELSAFASIAALMSAIVAVDRSKLAAFAAAVRNNSSEAASVRMRVMEITWEAVSGKSWIRARAGSPAHRRCSALAAREQRELLLEVLVAEDAGHAFAVLEYQ